MSTHYLIDLVAAIDNTAKDGGIIYRDWDDINKNLSTIDLSVLKGYVGKKGFGMMKWGNNLVILCDANNGDHEWIINSSLHSRM